MSKLFSTVLRDENKQSSHKEGIGALAGNVQAVHIAGGEKPVRVWAMDCFPQITSNEVPLLGGIFTTGLKSK